MNNSIRSDPLSGSDEGQTSLEIWRFYFILFTLSYNFFAVPVMPFVQWLVDFLSESL